MKRIIINIIRHNDFISWLIVIMVLLLGYNQYQLYQTDKQIVKAIRTQFELSKHINKNSIMNDENIEDLYGLLYMKGFIEKSDTSLLQYLKGMRNKRKNSKDLNS